MQSLKNVGIDWIRTRSSQTAQVDSADIVVALPQSMASLTIHDLLSRIGDIPLDGRPRDLEGMRRRWIPGREMTDQELLEFKRQLPPGCVIKGWRAECVPPGNYTGIALVKR
jgi:hypothetical protein